MVLIANLSVDFCLYQIGLKTARNLSKAAAVITQLAEKNILWKIYLCKIIRQPKNPNTLVLKSCSPSVYSAIFLYSDSKMTYIIIHKFKWLVIEERRGFGVLKVYAVSSIPVIFKICGCLLKYSRFWIYSAPTALSHTRAHPHIEVQEPKVDMSRPKYAQEGRRRFKIRQSGNTNERTNFFTQAT